MIDISNSIYRYYFDNFEQLPFDKQFHLASRLYLWDQDAEARLRLDQLREEFCHNGDLSEAVQNIIDKSASRGIDPMMNAAEQRRPYFEKYPLLMTYIRSLFRLLFCHTVYGLNIKDIFLKYFPEDEVESLAYELMADKEAVAVLSTHAVNFLYLYSRLIKEDSSMFEPSYFLDIGNRYDKNDRTQLLLLIYLYTHCIIGESLFYSRKPEDNGVYTKMLAEVESAIEARFDGVNLDNKFEFLVCTELLGQKSKLEARIRDEASKSISADGTFLVDTVNNNPQRLKISLADSEHRNVLFIMASRNFKPLS